MQRETGKGGGGGDTAAQHKMATVPSSSNPGKCLLKHYPPQYVCMSHTHLALPMCTSST